MVQGKMKVEKREEMWKGNNVVLQEYLIYMVLGMTFREKEMKRTVVVVRCVNLSIIESSHNKRYIEIHLDLYYCF